MKNSLNKKSDQAGFTLAELMVAVSMASVVGICATSLLLNGTILYAKNTAQNLAHDQNRIAVTRLVRDIHAAVSTPQLGKIVPGNLASNPGRAGRLLDPLRDERHLLGRGRDGSQFRRQL